MRGRFEQVRGRATALDRSNVGYARMLSSNRGVERLQGAQAKPQCVHTQMYAARRVGHDKPAAGSGGGTFLAASTDSRPRLYAASMLLMPPMLESAANAAGAADRPRDRTTRQASAEDLMAGLSC